MLHNHPDDASSVHIKVTRMQNEKYNSVLAYKPQIRASTLPGINNNHFLLIIQTEAQKEMYINNCGKILCIDSTHRTNQYDFKLITLLVIDEYYHGYPVAFCLSTTEDIAVITLFFQRVSERAGHPTVNVVMTDDDNTGWRAATDVFGSGIRHLLWQWHVFRAFTRKCLHIQGEDRDKIKDLLYWMMYEKDVTAYEEKKMAFVAKWGLQYPSLVTYMEENYFNREEKWTLAHRQSINYERVDTNNFIESFHNKLKTQYFKQKQNKRIDVLIETLEKLEGDYHLNKYKRIKVQKKI